MAYLLLSLRTRDKQRLLPNTAGKRSIYSSNTCYVLFSILLWRSNNNSIPIHVIDLTIQTNLTYLYKYDHGPTSTSFRVQ